ncbi:hypothetical protein Taro_051149 [Colocasia esculenta]|uniref:PWWP domain-containing protein n=1 Tax=Colocasia esculenta TaxID=4460 RepID=A0A843XFX6_COLES|nr:hypothetical protein [Colocasia esculenta]
MGSCCESDNTKAKRIDDTAGGLVWVRRRNGSWWPGRILGVDELPESYSVSPRAGTPVKLLGREDGSMDWYNLEKSKRIKAFRCGEYDECIEKARAYAVQSSKSGAKERKYARREDAILHALEIEQAHYTQSKQELVSTVNRRNGTVGYVGLVKEQNDLVRRGKLEDKHKTKFSQSKAPLEQTVDLNSVEVHVMQDESRKAPTDSEDDGTAGAKRMRGLQEFGLVVASKRKLDIVQPEGPHDPSLQDNTSLGESNIDNGFSSMSTINSGKEPCSSLKKRTQVVQAPETLKRKNRRRQLTKVLESSATVEVPSIHEGGNSSQSSLHGVTWNRVCASEPAETRRADYSEVVNGSLGSSETSCVEASLVACEDLHDPVVDHDGTDFCTLEFVDDGFLDIPVVWKEIQSGDHHGGSAPGVSGDLGAGAVERQDDRDCEVDPTKQDNKGNLKGSSGVIPQANNTRKCKGNSKEAAKGEKNCTYGHRSRGSKKVFGRFEQSESYFLDKPDIETEDRADNSTLDDSPMSHYGGQLMKCASVSNSTKDRSICSAPNVNRLANKNHERQVSGSEEIGVQSDEMGDILCSTPAHERVQDLLSTRDLPLTQLPHRRSLPRRQTHPPSCSCCQVGDLSIRSSTPGSALYDVELEVKASYQGRRVPLISLMSKLNGKAIIGHPITVEVLEDGYSNTFVRHCHVTRSSIDVCYGRKENRTKRKRDAIDDTLWDRGGIFVKSQRSKCITKLHSKRRRRPSDQLMVRSLSRRSSKIRKSGFLTRKIRKLSSITVDCEHKEEKRKAVVENPLRPVACVPLKIVFSRINEALSNSSRPENQV